MANISLHRNEQQGVQTGQQQQNRWVPSLVTNFDPFRMMERLLRGDLLQELAGPLARQGGAQGFFPSFEVKETKNAYVFKADLPGVKEADIEISLNGNQLTINGNRIEEQEDDVQNYFVYERSYGTFSRTFTLPEGVDAEHIRAEFKDGELRLIVPKRPEMQPRRIEFGGKQGKEDKPQA